MKSKDKPSLDYNADVKLKGFKVYEFDSKTPGGHTYSRKDFYKVNITTGKFIFHYADRSFETEGTFLFFGNPHVPYSCDLIAPKHSGYTCVFSEGFLKLGDRSESILQSPLFKLGGTPIIKLGKVQKAFVNDIFKKMLEEQDTDYAYKDDLIRNYIHLVIHEALKVQPSEEFAKNINASTRIASVFLELLERQFPIENKEQPLALRSAQDFAKDLSLHVNYLNSSVKEVTGKSTTGHIADRIISEAKALLQHTDWSISEIAYALGFEYPTYFNNFFKKKTGKIPKAIRAANL